VLHKGRGISWQGKRPLVLQQGLFGQLDGQTFTDVCEDGDNILGYLTDLLVTANEGTYYHKKSG